MASDIAAFGSLLAGTLALRPYVFAFLLAFLVAGGRDLGARATVGFLVLGSTVAFAAEYASTRVGWPFGLYHYTGDTRGRELFVANVPVFDSLSFPFLAYAAFCVARWMRGPGRGAGVVALAGPLMMLLDVVIDPLAVRGDRWFLGRVFSYAEAGVYFGVPLSNFAGWTLVGWLIVGGYAATGAGRGASDGYGRGPGPGVGLYWAVLGFNVALTAWIGEWALLAAGMLLHSAGFLLLYGASRWRARSMPRSAASRPPAPVGPVRDLQDRRDGPR